MIFPGSSIAIMGYYYAYDVYKRWKSEKCRISGVTDKPNPAPFGVFPWVYSATFKDTSIGSSVDPPCYWTESPILPTSSEPPQEGSEAPATQSRTSSSKRTGRKDLHVHWDPDLGPIEPDQPSDGAATFSSSVDPSWLKMRARQNEIRKRISQALEPRIRTFLLKRIDHYKHLHGQRFSTLDQTEPAAGSSHVDRYHDKATTSGPSQIDSSQDRASKPGPSHVDTSHDKATTSGPSQMDSLQDRASKPRPSHVDTSHDKASTPGPSQMDSSHDRAGTPGPSHMDPFQGGPITPRPFHRVRTRDNIQQYLQQHGSLEDSDSEED